MKPFFVNVPYPMLLARIEEVVSRGLCPEIVFEATTLDTLDRKEASDLARTLREGGLENTFHGPFRDLSPGALDTRILAVTRERFEQTMAAAEIFTPRCVVFHSGYDPWQYQGYEDPWMESSVETWRHLAERAVQVDTVVAVENVFEKTPSTLQTLLQRVGSSRLRHCFDIGHLSVFGETSMNGWLAVTAPYIVELHLHDNRQDNDDHLPLGTGSIDFARLFRLIQRYVPVEPIYALEPSREEDLEPSIQGFFRFTG